MALIGGECPLRNVFKVPAKAMPFIHTRCDGQNYEELGCQLLVYLANSRL